MSEKGGTEKTSKNNKRTIELSDGTIVKASCIYKNDTKLFKIQNIEFDKIKTSNKRL